MRQIAVTQVAGGFSVQVAYLPGGDEQWIVLTHRAVFPSEARAARFAERVRAKCGADLQGIDLACWRWESHGASCPLAEFQCAHLPGPLVFA